MSTRRLLSFFALVFACLATPAWTVAASPTASAAPASAAPTEPATPVEQLVGASVEIARNLVNVGLVLVVVSFIVMIVTVIVTTPALKDAIKQVVDKWKAAVQLQEAEDTPPAFPYTDLFRSVFGSIPDLIKTPVGVGVALILLAVVLLLGQGAIVGGFTESGSTAETPAASVAPTDTATSPPTNAPSEAAPSALATTSP